MELNLINYTFFIQKLFDKSNAKIRIFINIFSFYKKINVKG